MIDDIIEAIKKLGKEYRKENRGGTEHEEILESIKSIGISRKNKIKKRWWLFYEKIDKRQNTQKYIFCRKIYPVFTGLKFQLGEKE